jgi:hypothetical protein
VQLPNYMGCLMDFYTPYTQFIYVYRVSHNTWDYKNALGQPLNDNIESWQVSYFEAKDHTLVQLLYIDIAIIVDELGIKHYFRRK